MDYKILNKEEMYSLCDVVHNPPAIRSDEDETRFQDEMKEKWDRLVLLLSDLGEEGDYCDFGLAPYLRDFETFTATAPHARSFNLEIYTQRFFYSDYLGRLHRFLSHEASDCLLQIDKDFAPEWIFRVFLTTNLAQIYCSNDNELKRVVQIISAL